LKCTKNKGRNDFYMNKSEMEYHNEFAKSYIESLQNMHNSISLVCFSKKHPGCVLLAQRSPEAKSYPKFWSLPSKRVMPQVRWRTTQFGDTITSIHPFADIEDAIIDILLSLGIGAKQIRNVADEEPYAVWNEKGEQDRGDHRTRMSNIPVMIQDGDVTIKDPGKYTALAWVPFEEARELLRPAAEQGSLCSENFQKSLSRFLPSEQQA